MGVGVSLGVSLGASAGADNSATDYGRGTVMDAKGFLG